MWLGTPPQVRNVEQVVRGHAVFTFDFLTHAHAKQVLAAIENGDQWRDSTVTSPKPGMVLKVPTYRRQSQISVYAVTSRTQMLFAEEFKVLRETAADLLKLPASSLEWCRVAQYQRSVPGDFFHWHRDPSPMFPLRAIAICYLSDASSHALEGGTTDFMLDGIPHSVKPAQGRVVLFDPNIIHRGATVEKGVKYAFTFGWI